IRQLEVIREQYPNIGIILLSTLYDIQGIKELREFTKKSSKGCAFLLKHSIDRIGQLTQVVHAVTEGQVILDSVVMEGLIGAGEAKTTFLKELTHRELEVLSWMAKGYRNGTIAEILCVDPKTIERHINAIYSKLNMVTESKHPRVNSIMLYLRATGQLPCGDVVEG
ncbi:MAG: LuxR C-terminal-related transcriptional regulator, partial [Dehalococcoidia bacterium]|nr:LuxR C-terminal-related transcriptional regulator [Dehalococcoidia bacterium]